MVVLLYESLNRKRWGLMFSKLMSLSIEFQKYLVYT